MPLLLSANLYPSSALPNSSFPLRLNPVPPQNRSLQCYSLATPRHSGRFLRIPKLFRSVLFRNNSCRLYVFPTQFIVFPNYSFAPIYAVPLSIIAVLFPSLSPPFRTIPVLFSTKRFFFCSSLFDSIAIRGYSHRFFACALRVTAPPFHYCTLLYFTKPLPLIAKLFCRLYTKQVV